MFMLRVLLRVLLLELVVNNCQLQCLRRPRGSPLPLLVWMHRNRLPRLTTDTTEKLSLGYTAILRSVIFIHFRSISYTSFPSPPWFVPFGCLNSPSHTHRHCLRSMRSPLSGSHFHMLRCTIPTLRRGKCIAWHSTALNMSERFSRLT